jgi:betaine-aldehyde dehydrogenase
LLRPFARARGGVGVRPLHGAVRGARARDSRRRSARPGDRDAAAQRDAVASFLDDGDPVVCRGSAPEGPGFWFAPTILAPAARDARVLREEVFGPIVAVIPFRDEEDAVALANDSIYGLSGSIWTRDGARALRVARGIETGVLSINSNSSVRVTTPFGGFKQSGYGRELGPHALDAYTEVKTIFFATS